jgi:hypothetical protein
VHYEVKLADFGQEKTFWTDMTRQGCAGQYSSCFANASDSFKIYASPFDGNCVAYRGSSGQLFYDFKTMQCKTRLKMACFGFIRVEEFEPHVKVN